MILKAVQRKDLIETLPLPRRLLDYLQNKNFLSELIESDSSSQSQVSQILFWLFDLKLTFPFCHFRFMVKIIITILILTKMDSLFWKAIFSVDGDN